MAIVPKKAVAKYGVTRAIEAVNALAPIWLDLTRAAMGGIAIHHVARQCDLLSQPQDTGVERIERFVKEVGEAAFNATLIRLQTMAPAEHDKVVSLVRRHKKFVWWHADGSRPWLVTRKQIDRGLAKREQRLTEFGLKRLVGLQLGAAVVAEAAGAPDVDAAVQNSAHLGKNLAGRVDIVEDRTVNSMAGVPAAQTEHYDSTDLSSLLSGELVLGKMVYNGNHNRMDLKHQEIKHELNQLPSPKPHESIHGDVKGCHVPHTSPDGLDLLWHMTHNELMAAGFSSLEKLAK